MLDLLLLGNQQIAVGGWVAAFLVLSLGIGRAVRLSPLEGAAFGFLVLAGAADLAMFAARALVIPTPWFGPLTLAFAALIISALRRILPSVPSAPGENRAAFALAVLVTAGVLWTLRIIQIDPLSSMSSHHGWLALYVENSFRLGHLAKVEEMAFGHGYLTSIFYNVDLMGLVAFGEWAAAGSAWAAYSAGSTLAAMLSVAVLAHALRPSRAALGVFAALVLVLLATDFLYRTTMARNWGDAIQFLGGAVMLYFMSRGIDLRRAALWTGAAAIFLVFSRHFGAFYAGMILGFGYLAVWRLEGDRRLWPWIGLGVLLVGFSAREIWCILVPPSPFYPGQKLVEVAPAAGSMMIIGSLNDLGITTEGRLSAFLIGPRNLYLAALSALLVLHGRRLWNRPRLLFPYLAPLLLVALPQVLQAGVGYRSDPTYSKTTLIGLHLMAFYPAFAVMMAAPSLSATARRAGAMATFLALVVTASMTLPRLVPDALPWREGPTAVLRWAAKLYRDHNLDLNMAERLRDSEGVSMPELAARPILYFHYEPGLALRHFIGGDFFCDLDFWSAPVRSHFGEAATLGELVARLGYPNLYLSFADPTLYARYFDDGWRKYEAEIRTLERQPFVDKVVRHNNGTFYVTRRPAGIAPACPAGAAP